MPPQAPSPGQLVTVRRRHFVARTPSEPMRQKLLDRVIEHNHRRYLVAAGTTEHQRRLDLIQRTVV